LQWWVLKNFADLAHTHVACWCDNTTTVAGASRLLSTKAKKAARLLGILALRRLRARHWVNVLPRGFDPYLQNLDEKQQLAELQAFAQRAREGTFRRGKRV